MTSAAALWAAGAKKVKVNDFMPWKIQQPTAAELDPEVQSFIKRFNERG